MSVYGSYEVTFDNPNSTWGRAGAMVAEGSTVLDVGCSAGQLAEALRTARGCVVDGVEIDPVDAEAARARCRQVFVGDLLSVVDQIGTTYDHVVLLDVLEHLPDPVAGLAAVAGLLTPEGTAIVSVPNMGHASVRLQLLQGHFPAEAEGLLDRTHLRFFDETTLRELVAGSPLVLDSLDRVVLDIPPEIVTAALAEVGLEPTAAFADVIASREASTYQFVARLRHRRPGEEPATAARAEYVAPLDQYWAALRDAQARAGAAEQALIDYQARAVEIPAGLIWVKRLRAALRRQ